MEVMQEQDYHIVKKVQQSKRNDKIKIGLEFFLNHFFMENGKIYPFTITDLRIIFLIHNTFSSVNETGHFLFKPTKEPKQIDLFEQDFMTQHNTFIRVTLKNSDISPSQNKSHIEKSLQNLTKFKMGWYSDVNRDGKEIKSYGGLISLPSCDNGQTSFLISSYWLKQILMMERYIYNLMETITISSAKNIVFSIWLGSINETTGRVIGRNTLNNKFDLNYKDTKSLCDQFLRPIKKVLDKKGFRSFNYKRKGDNIIIMPYDTNNTLPTYDAKTIENINKHYQLSYFKKRHKLENEHLEILKNLYKQEYSRIKIEIFDAYEHLKKECRKKKIPMTSYVGIEFLKALQNSIIETYKLSRAYHSSPNGYIKII